MDANGRKKWPDDYRSADKPADGYGIACVKCGGKRARVVYTRDRSGNKRVRLRECGNCGHRFPTFERQ